MTFHQRRIKPVIVEETFEPGLPDHLLIGLKNFLILLGSFPQPEKWLEDGTDVTREVVR